VSPSNKIAFLSEELCIGCGICVKKCPFEAIMIINLPKNLEKETSHRYGPNSFKLHRMPLPRPGQVRRERLEMQSWVAERGMRDSLREKGRGGLWVAASHIR
jgi:ferredoxin